MKKEVSSAKQKLLEDEDQEKGEVRGQERPESGGNIRILRSERRQISAAAICSGN